MHEFWSRKPDPSADRVILDAIRAGFGWVWLARLACMSFTDCVHAVAARFSDQITHKQLHEGLAK